MEEKELKVDIPEGYEIDEENSTFECIKFKPIKSNLSYKDICDSIFKYCIPGVYSTRGKNLNRLQNRSVSITTYSERQLGKIKAINQLFNIAKYYNENWEPNWDDSTSVKYVINYNKVHDIYEIDFLQELNYGCVYFKSEEDAQKVINNPNFKEILDTIFK